MLKAGRIYVALPAWTAFSFLAGLGISIPLLVSVSGLLSDGSTLSWGHTLSNVLPRYLGQTMTLCIGVALGTLVTGTVTAWLISFYDFPARKVLGWAIILPLTLPTYLAAFAYRDFLDTSGVVPGLLRMTGLDLPAGSGVDIMSMWGTIFVFSSVLYPYVYLTLRASFSSDVAPYFNSARLFGLSGTRVLVTVALPLARPAAAAGVSLALMETLNDYGAVHYFGIDTLTVGIFRTWFSFGDLGGARRLAALLLAGGVLLFLVERMHRGRARYTSSHLRTTPAPRRLRGWSGAAACFLCFLPVLVGFLFPLSQLLWWLGRIRTIQWNALARTAGSSLAVALVAALLVVGLATLLVHASVNGRSRVLHGLTAVCSLGYAVPGAVIAVGVLVVSTGLDRSLGAALKPHMSLVLTGSLTLLVYAYCVRFMAVGLNPVDGAFRQRCRGYDEAARTLGCGPFSTLLRVNLPVLRPTLVAASILVFVDVLKELPLTLILRPFNFETLATRVFESAIDERVAESAPAALLIVAVSLVPILLLNRLQRGRP